ncbi:MAG TPA: hypothetical protein VFL27_14550 [Candidatus Dormibacteraeota bacterium]|nr:hypothetical protein [Candidatus Dormibacteraeota bacterium]
MRRTASALVMCVAVAACGGSGNVASSTPTVAGSSRPSASASAAAGPYGLLIVGGQLELIKTDASVAAQAPITLQGLDCSPQHDAVNLEPPVSATNDQVYYRDGGKIRMVVPPSGASDVTTVPNGPTVVSFFSVSPDDQKIAVVVMDVSSSTSISLRLYVEDLHGGGNHADIYSTVQTKSKTATTLWPMGWHLGLLVLAVVAACTFEPVGLYPSEWHVSNATTADRVTTIKGVNCQLGVQPSAAGVSCADPSGTTTMYDWTNRVLGVTGPGAQFTGLDTGLSPAGRSIYFATTGLAAPATRIVQLGPGPYATVQGHSACGWIDEDHLISPDAVIQFPAETPGNVQVNTKVTALGQAGVCAGRFPGSL